jgi:hypothetical protein
LQAPIDEQQYSWFVAFFRLSINLLELTANQAPSSVLIWELHGPMDHDACRRPQSQVSLLPFCCQRRQLILIQPGFEAMATRL